MSYATITGITIAIAVVVVIGIGLLSYMSSLIKSAYQIKVEMRSDLENGLKKIEEELRQKSKWMRSEVGEDVVKMKDAIERENDRRLTQIQEQLQGIVREADEASRAERGDLRAALLQVRQSVSALDKDVSALKDEAARRAALGRPAQARREADRDTEAGAVSIAASLQGSGGGSPDASPEAASAARAANGGGDVPSSRPAAPTAAAKSGDSERSTGNRPPGPTASGGSQRVALQDFGDKNA